MANRVLQEARQLLPLLLLQQIEEVENQAVIAAVMVMREGQVERRRRRWWVKPWITRRPMLGQYDTLFAELDRESQGDYFAYLRMDRNLFAEVLRRVAPRITKGLGRGRRPLEPQLKLVITLRYMASGDSYHSLAYSFRVPHNTISLFIPPVCRAICAEFKDELFTVPTTPEEWREIADKFSQRWNFQHCCGAIDGKHIEIKKPRKSGSMFYNYKGFFSIILLAVVDANYKFIWANVGADGSVSDAGVFNNSRLRPALEQGRLGFPPPEPLPGDDKDIPYFLIGDDAFPLREWMQKPYSQRGLEQDQRVFNYRLSRARRVSENAFGIMVQRWRCLLTCMQQEPQNCQDITHACLTLHNLLRDRAPAAAADFDREDDEGNLIPGAWRNNVQLHDPQAVCGQRSSKEGKILRNYLCDYYNNYDKLPWQDRIA